LELSPIDFDSLSNSRPDAILLVTITQKGAPMTCLLGKPITKEYASLSSQVETIQDDLLRFSQFVSQLTLLTDEELATIDIFDELQTIHHCLNRFETHSLANQIGAHEDEFSAPVEYEPTVMTFPGEKNWTSVRREAKHVNKLASQLTSSLNKIRAGLREHQFQDLVPEDIAQINQVVGNAVSGIASEWITNLD
jgi:hypothetical protein